MGNGARDRGDWPAAEQAYKEHLLRHADDFDIWIQLGHSLKEQSKFEEAEAAYRRGLELRPDDHDVNNQLAHLLKRMNRYGAAAEIFSELLRRSGTKEAYEELNALRSKGVFVKASLEMPSKLSVDNTVYVELDDLLFYLDDHRTLSGIQRVQVSVIQHVLLHAREEGEQKYIFVLNPAGSDTLWALQLDDLGQIASYVTSQSVDHLRLRDMVATARRNAVSTTPRAGQCYLVLGAFWAGGGVAGRYAHLKQLGVIIGAYIYDLIPITHAQYCDEGLPHEFTLSFGDGLTIFDFLLTISEFTASEVQRYIEGLGLPPKPIQAVPLAHAMSDDLPHGRSDWGEPIAFLRDRPFVMMVSTIEARKNHNFLVSAWKQFLDEGLDPPDLVFVGRVGWRVTSLMEMLEVTHYLDNRIHILHDLSDAELNTLYDACLFTAFPSFVEGWGLPVGESLAHGKPCVTSSTSSLPEVGGRLADYVDPFNLRDGIEVLRRMAFNAPYRMQRSTDIREKFQPRTWKSVGSDLLMRVDQMRQKVKVAGPSVAYFPSGTFFRPRSLAFGQRLPRDYAVNASRLMLGRSWYQIEGPGCWMRGGAGAISFRTELRAGADIVAYVQLYGAPASKGETTLKVSVGSGTATSTRHAKGSGDVRIRPGAHFFVRVRGKVGDDSVVTIGLRVDGPLFIEEGPAAKQFGIGLDAVGYVAQADVEGRIEMLEELMVSIEPRARDTDD